MGNNAHLVAHCHVRDTVDYETKQDVAVRAVGVYSEFPVTGRLGDVQMLVVTLTGPSFEEARDAVLKYAAVAARWAVPYLSPEDRERALVFVREFDEYVRLEAADDVEAVR